MHDDNTIPNFGARDMKVDKMACTSLLGTFCYDKGYRHHVLLTGGK